MTLTHLLEQIESVAQKNNDEDWRISNGTEVTEDSIYSYDGKWICNAGESYNPRAAYIALMSPATALKLVRVIRKLIEQRDAAMQVLLVETKSEQQWPKLESNAGKILDAICAGAGHE